MKDVTALILLISVAGTSYAWPTPQHFLRRRNDSRLYSSSSNEDSVLRLPLLEAELALISDESSTKSLELASAIEDAKTAAEFGVRRAQVQFYESFSNGDIDGMKATWSQEDDIRCIHPGMSALEGQTDVMASWARIFSGESFQIEPSRVKIDIYGRTAMCSCIEETKGGGKLEALNVYRREQGRWCMILHMASPVMMLMG